MLAKLKVWMIHALGKLPKLRMSNVWVTLLALILLFAVIILYIATWIYLMFWRAATTLAELKEIIVIMCGAPLVTAISTLRSGLVDKDGNGISDDDEKEDKNGNSKHLG